MADKAAAYLLLLSFTLIVAPLLCTKDCSNMLWALGTLKLYPPDTWLEAMYEESFSQLPYFTTQNCANTVWGWARLSHWPPEVGASEASLCVLR